MPTKKAKKSDKSQKKSVASAAESEAVTKKKSEEEKSLSKYFSAVGKRKTSIAQIRIYKSKKSEGEMTVNGKEMVRYFPIERLSELIKSPLKSSTQSGTLDVSIKVVGGGTNSQAEAIRLGIARALVKMDGTLRKSLKDQGFLTRDSRIVERKKAGLKKARRAPQWAKR